MGLLSRFRRTPAPPVVYADDGTLELLVAAPDPAVADSAVLAGVDADLTRPLLVRHHLVGLPDEAAVERARALLAQDGYTLTVLDGPPFAVRAWRTQVLTAMSASQERSRMAGLAQRLGGDVAGWDALQPAAGPDPSVVSGP
ncbi:MAG: hypothetical protein JWN17_1981 [Frankiales bacterium]|nr:hypothetical protein [Frankiales bacterium]